MGVLAHVTTCGYQQVPMKSEAAVSDWHIWQYMTFREPARTTGEL